jgi:hypothetical protein
MGFGFAGAFSCSEPSLFDRLMWFCLMTVGVLKIWESILKDGGRASHVFGCLVLVYWVRLVVGLVLNSKSLKSI